MVRVEEPKAREPVIELFSSSSVLMTLLNAVVMLVMAVSIRVLIGSASFSLWKLHFTVFAAVVSPASGGGLLLKPLIAGAVNGFVAKLFSLLCRRCVRLHTTVHFSGHGGKRP